MKSTCFSFLFIFLLPLLMIAQQQDSTRLYVADIKTIHSNLLNQDREIYIYSPKSNFEFPDEALPVLYLLDADVHMSMVVSQIKYLSEVYNVLPPMIIVGIANYKYDRIHDLTPTHAETNAVGAPVIGAFKTSGGGESFMQFIKTELMPYVEGHYKTIPYKIISGHSLGGLMAVYALTTHPEMFNAFIAVSPSMWWDKETELKKTNDLMKQKNTNNKTVFISDGNEGGPFRKSVLKLDSILKNFKGLRSVYHPYPEETHGSEPAKAEYDALKLVAEDLLPSANDTTAAMVSKFYENISEKYGAKISPSFLLVNRLGYFSLANGKVEQAIDFFSLNEKNYSSSWAAYDALGDAYLQKNDKANAIKNFKKALELKPSSEDLKEKLKKLE